MTARYVSWLASGPHVDLWGRYNAKRLIGISSNRTDLGAARLIPLKLLSHYGRENLSQASSEIQNFNLLSSHFQLKNVCVPSIDVSIRKLTKLSTTDEVEISRMLKEELGWFFDRIWFLWFISLFPIVQRYREGDATHTYLSMVSLNLQDSVSRINCGVNGPCWFWNWTMYYESNYYFWGIWFSFEKNGSNVNFSVTFQKWLNRNAG